VSTDVDPMIGTAIAGRYVVRQKLGAGGMGSVYLATQEPLGREVAVKVMLKELIADEVAVQRFHAEAQAVSRLNHPNIVTVFDFGATDDGTLFLVMEKLEGETLVSRLRRGPLPFAEAAPVIAQVARALHAAHAKGIVHRDLKPENVMITKADGNEVVIKVLDFGLAKMVSGERRTGLTASDVIMGTPGYMSPEQIHGFPIDARSDLYALGVIAWEMLTGRQLFSATSPVKILMRHLEEIPPPPSSVMPSAGIPSAAEALIARLLEKSADRRPATGEQVAVGILNPSTESWAVAPAGAGLPSQAPVAASAKPVVAVGAGGWDDAFSVLGDASFRAPTPVQQAKPALPDVAPSPALMPPVHLQSPHAPAPSLAHAGDVNAAFDAPANHQTPMFSTSAHVAAAPFHASAPHAVTEAQAPETFSPPAPSPVTPGPAPAVSSTPFNPYDALGIPQAAPPHASAPQATTTPSLHPAPLTPTTPHTAHSLGDEPAAYARPPVVASTPRPRPSEPLWTIKRGDRSESGIPESTMRRLAKDGHLKPFDLVAPSGEEPRQAHTFAILGLRPPATPVVEVKSKRAAAVGAGRGSAPVGAFVTVLLVGGVLAALFVFRPTWLDELREMAAEATETRAPDTEPNDTPIVAGEQALALSWKAVVDGLAPPAKSIANAEEALAELAKGANALDDETAEGAANAEKAAVAVLKHASDDESARALFLEARSRRQGSARLLAAIDALALAAHLNPKKLDEKRAQVSVLVALDDPRAPAEARALVLAAPDDAIAHVLHAEAALRTDLDESAQAVHAALLRAPRSSRARAMRGAILARAGSLDEAAPLLDERLARDPTDTNALIARALVDFRRGETESAVKRLERGVAATPDDDRLRLAAVRLAVTTKRAPARVKALFAGAPPRTSTDAHFQRFLVERAVHVADADVPAAATIGDDIYALVVVERALRASEAPSVTRALDPIVANGGALLGARARAFTAEAALVAGRFDDAASSFKQSALEGEVLLGHAGRIVAQLAAGDAEGAATSTTALLDVDLLTGLSFDPLFDHRFLSEAPTRLFERIAERLAPDENADIARALLKLAVHDLAGARTHLESAKKRDATHPVVLSLFAMIELAREKPVLALFHLSKLPPSNGGDSPALLPLLLRAEAQIAVENIGAAKKAIVDIPSKDDTKGARARVFGALLARQGQPEEARVQFLAALTAVPFDGRAQSLLARLPSR
jgi:serine/threonine protein kinase/tetratricopeptide (TPR) repeat protein